MVLEVEDEIHLSTRIGTSVVQLMLGDITDLSVEDKVDIVFTSAFPGDYGSGIKTTLFYALKSRLGISARSLSRDKEMDLVQNFSCWLSKPLPEDKPFKRLACFEVLRNQYVTEQISMVFRAMMPVFSGVESSVITPPLATGCQGVPIEKMVNLMVNTACHWIKAGLPLTCMKLVLFTRDVTQARMYQYTEAIKIFKSLKHLWEQKEKEDDSESFDLALSFHEQDKELVDKIKSTFLKVNKKLKIHSLGFVKNAGDSWQEDVFKILSNSKRIVVVLTQSYVSDKWCHEQFSMALCCNRLKGDEVTIPFFMEKVESPPSYMNLVQYKECRVRKDGETADGKLTEACSEVSKLVLDLSDTGRATMDASELIVKRKQTPAYDIFISYSHRNTKLAKHASETLKKKYPKLNIFLDSSELKTGNIWQQTLYEAVDKSNSMIAFLSDAYIKSSVCQEEYSIAIARMKAKDNFLLVPIYMPELSALTTSNSPWSPVNISSENDIEDLVDKMMPSVEKIISGEDAKKELDTKVIRNIQINHRFEDFKKNFKFDETDKKIVPLHKNKVPNDFNLSGTIAFVYGGSNGLRLSACLDVMLKDYPNIVRSILSSIQAQARKQIDDADIVVIFVSDDFLRAQNHLEELHIALCRQRTVNSAKDSSTVVYLIEVDHEAPLPFYTHLLPYKVCTDDPMWRKYGKSLGEHNHRFENISYGIQGTYMCSSAENLALMKATFDIVELIAQRGQGSSLPTNLVNVAKMQLSTKGKEDKNITLSEIPTINSFTPYMGLKAERFFMEDGSAAEEGTSASYDINMTQEEEISPEERARRTDENRPKDPADEVISHMNNFLVNKPDMLQEPTSTYLQKKTLQRGLFMSPPVEAPGDSESKPKDATETSDEKHQDLLPTGKKSKTKAVKKSPSKTCVLS